MLSCEFHNTIYLATEFTSISHYVNIGKHIEHYIVLQLFGILLMSIVIDIQLPDLNSRKVKNLLEVMLQNNVIS